MKAEFRGLITAALTLSFSGCSAGDSKDDDPVPIDTDSVTCGEGTSLQDGVCVADPVTTIVCGEGTHLEGDACVPDVVEDTDLPVLERGYYEPPITWLQKQVGQGGALGPGGAGQTHMHTSEMVYRAAAADRPAMVFYCSYTFGVLNANDAQSMSYMAQGWFHYPNGYPETPLSGTRAPGCVNLTLDEDDPNIAYTTHHGNLTDGDAFLSGWNIQMTRPDPARPTSVTLAPVQLPMTQEGNGVSYEGLDYEGGYLYVALHEEGLGVFERDLETNVISRVATLSGELANAWDVRVVDGLAYVADGEGGLAILDASDPLDLSLIGRASFPGSAHDLAVGDGVVYVAAQGGGLVLVDVSDPTAPEVMSTVPVPASAIAIDYDPAVSRVYLGAWADARVYDVADPYNPEIIGGKRLDVHKAYSGDGGDRPNITDRVLGIAGRGDFVFNGTWWTPNSLQVHADRRAPYMFLPENINFLSFPGDLQPGETSEQTIIVRNDGNEPLTIYDMWADNPLFSVSPPQLRIPPGDDAVLSLTFTAGAVVQEEKTLFHIVSDDPTQPMRDAYLVGNQATLAVGDPFPETTATLLGAYGGQEWSSVQETGNVVLLGYWATF
jgi:hypothetical protein